MQPLPLATTTMPLINTGVRIDLPLAVPLDPRGSFQAAFDDIDAEVEEVEPTDDPELAKTPDETPPDHQDKTTRRRPSEIEENSEESMARPLVPDTTETVTPQHQRQQGEARGLAQSAFPIPTGHLTTANTLGTKVMPLSTAGEPYAVSKAATPSSSQDPTKTVIAAPRQEVTDIPSRFVGPSMEPTGNKKEIRSGNEIHQPKLTSRLSENRPVEPPKETLGQKPPVHHPDPVFSPVEATAKASIQPTAEITTRPETATSQLNDRRSVRVEGPLEKAALVRFPTQPAFDMLPRRHELVQLRPMSSRGFTSTETGELGLIPKAVPGRVLDALPLLTIPPQTQPHPRHPVAYTLATPVQWFSGQHSTLLEPENIEGRQTEMAFSTVRAEGGHHHVQTNASARAELPAHVVRQLADVVGQMPNRPVEITLSPEELGRVRLTVQVSETGIVVSLLAERPETLELMRRHIDQLGQDFLDMGFENIAFSFSGDEAEPDTDGGPPNSEGTEFLQPESATEPTQINLRSGATSGLDLRL